MAYTKGEWKADHNSGVVLIFDSEGEVEHVIARHIIDQDIDLISAAPDMYEALRDIRDGIVANQERLGHDRFEKLMNAIKKVE